MHVDQSKCRDALLVNDSQYYYEFDLFFLHFRLQPHNRVWASSLPRLAILIGSHVTPRPAGGAGCAVQHPKSTNSVFLKVGISRIRVVVAACDVADCNTCGLFFWEPLSAASFAPACHPTPILSVADVHTRRSENVNGNPAP